jgi:hypothetical protein
VHAVRLHERHRCGNPTEQLVVDRGSGGSGRGLLRRRGGLGRRRLLDGRAAVAAPTVRSRGIEQALEPGKRGDEARVPALEELTPRGLDRLGILEVLLEEEPDVAGVQPR